MNRPRRLLAVVLLAAAVTGCGSGPRTLLHGSTGRAFALPDPGTGIRRFAWVDSGQVARGGQPDDDGLRWLADHGFRTVITFRQHHDEEAALARAGLPLVEIPIQCDLFGSSPPTEAQVAQFLSIARDSSRRPVYFHCARGADRTGMFAALYRIEVDGWTNAEAIEEMQAFGYNNFYKDLIGYVRTYRPRTPSAD
jgi:protein tyrosine/serine phosphatase